MFRGVLALGAGLSLILLAAIVGLWVRSYWTGSEIVRGGPTQVELASEAGRVALVVSHPAEAGEPFRPGWRIQDDSVVLADDSTPANGEQFRYHGLGFEWASYHPAPPGRSVPGAGMRYWLVVVPHWFAAGLTLVIPAFWLRWGRRKPAEGGVCRRCGYDLRATPDRCPECGEPVVDSQTRSGRRHLIS